MSRVVLGLSGGVDSAVAAHLLREAGYHVHTVTLRLWPSPATEAAIARASATARHLGLPWHLVEGREHFRREVVEPFVESYAAGRTPNPCVLCNPRVKLHLLQREADRLGAAWIATGHYARLHREPDGITHLLAARDPRRDQSYFLYRLGQPLLRRLLLPLGELTKAEVRAIARRLDLPAAESRDSQDLCFIEGGDYRAFLRRMRPSAFRPGPIRTVEGEVVGRHAGLPAYTIGQRKGLGVVWREPLYVVGMSAESNALIVGTRAELGQEEAELEEVVFTVAQPPLPAEVEVRTRHRAPRVPAVLSNEGGRWLLRFREAQRAVAPGQSAVLYRGEEVIGGGFFAASSSATISV